MIFHNIKKLIQHIDTLYNTLEKNEAEKSLCDIFLSPKFVQSMSFSDPFLPSYYQKCLDLYKSLSGKDNYSPDINELAPYADQLNVKCNVTPYYFKDSTIIGDFLSSWGWIMKILNVKEGDSVLEYGCGEGQLSLHLARSGIYVSVVDIEKRYLDLINKQAQYYNIFIDTYLGKFGEGFNEKKFDRILFFESFHHAINHLEVLKKLKNKINKNGFIVFSGEPIISQPFDRPSPVPFPWGPRLDGLSISSMRKWGWMELGFNENYFIDMLMQSGYLVKFYPCPVTFRGNCYTAELNKGRIDLGNNYVIASYNCDTGWHPGEGNLRWTKGEALLPLDKEKILSGMKNVRIELTNILPIKDHQVEISINNKKNLLFFYPGETKKVTIESNPDCSYLRIFSKTHRPVDLAISSDTRELGIAVKYIEYL